MLWEISPLLQPRNKTNDSGGDEDADCFVWLYVLKLSDNKSLELQLKIVRTFVSLPF